MNTDIQRLFKALEKGIIDPRKPRGVRHPALAIVKLVVVGLMCRLTSVEQICVLAQQWWTQLKEPLGFTRQNPPHPTTVTRLLSRITVDNLSKAFQNWMSTQLREQTISASVDGKTANNARDEDGVVMMVNVFAHDLKVSLAGFDVAKKSGEPTVLAENLASLFAQYPGLKLLTGDAYYAGRNLCQAIVDLRHDYLMAVKKNAGELYEAIELEFSHSTAPPAACEVDKKRGL